MLHTPMDPVLCAISLTSVAQSLDLNCLHGSCFRAHALSRFSPVADGHTLTRYLTLQNHT